jgi:hypothetical protein
VISPENGFFLLIVFFIVPHFPKATPSTEIDQSHVHMNSTVILPISDIGSILNKLDGLLSDNNVFELLIFTFLAIVDASDHQAFNSALCLSASTCIRVISLSASYQVQGVKRLSRSSANLLI